jgi:hypothetical protein
MLYILLYVQNGADWSVGARAARWTSWVLKRQLHKQALQQQLQSEAKTSSDAVHDDTEQVQ